jgi:hypothetical protein
MKDAQGKGLSGVSETRDTRPASPWGVVITFLTLFAALLIFPFVGDFGPDQLRRLPTLPYLLACTWPDLCKYPLAPFLFPFLVVVILSAALFLALSKRSAPETVWRDSQAVATCWQVNRRLLWPALVIALALETSIVSAILTGSEVPIPLWIAAICSAALACWALDRSQGTRPPLLLADAGYALGAFLMLLGLAGAGAGRLSLALPCLLLAGGALWLSTSRARGETAFGSVRERSVLLISILVCFFLYTYGLRSWRYSMIGDEYGFFIYANSILRGGTRAHPLAWRGVYDVHPVLSSYVHVASLWLFGADTYGWRVSSVILALWAALPLHALLRELLPGRAALLGAIFYVSSHYLMSFCKIGYNNSQALWPFLLSLALFVPSLRTLSPLGAFLAGVAAGLGFYTFAAARLVLVPLLLAFLFLAPARSRRLWGVGGALLVGLTLTALPILVAPESWRGGLAQTAFGPLAAPGGDTAGHLLVNFAFAAISFLYSSAKSHFVAGAHLDPLSAGFAAIGLGLLLCSRHARRSRAFVAGSYLFMLFAIGAMHQYKYPTNTRMFMLIPFYALFAGLGLHYCLTVAERLFAVRERQAGMVNTFLASLILSSLALNFYQSAVVSPKKIQQPATAMLLRIAQGTPDGRRLYFAAKPGYNRDVPPLMFSLYRIPAERLEILTPAQMRAFISEAEPEQEGDLLLIEYALPERDALRAAVRAGWPELKEHLVSDESGHPHLLCFADEPFCAGVFIR